MLLEANSSAWLAATASARTTVITPHRQFVQGWWAAPEQLPPWTCMDTVSMLTQRALLMTAAAAADVTWFKHTVCVTLGHSAFANNSQTLGRGILDTASCVMYAQPSLR
jgi:hypothetical protein